MKRNTKYIISITIVWWWQVCNYCINVSITVFFHAILQSCSEGKKKIV